MDRVKRIKIDNEMRSIYPNEVDSSPQAGSDRMVTSGGVSDAVANILAQMGVMDGLALHKAGNESVMGVKTFNRTIEGTARNTINDESGNNIKGSYASNILVSGKTVYLRNKNNLTLASFVLPSTGGVVSQNWYNQVGGVKFDNGLIINWGWKEFTYHSSTGGAFNGTFTYNYSSVNSYSIVGAMRTGNNAWSAIGAYSATSFVADTQTYKGVYPGYSMYWIAIGY